MTRATLNRRSSALAVAIGKAVGADELGMFAALALLTAGLWPRFGRDTLIVDGVIVLYMFLPSRAPFIVSTVKDERKKD